MKPSTPVTTDSGKKSTEACDLCGHHGDLVPAIVEGSMVRVCSRCRTFGNVVSMRNLPARDVRSRELHFQEYQEVVVPRASELIKRAREERELTQEQLAKMIGQKQSWLHKVETGHIHLTPEQARTFERFFGLHLIERYEDPKGVSFDVRDSRLTVGDLLKLKKRS